jgi:hypothetical protein
VSRDRSLEEFVGDTSGEERDAEHPPPEPEDSEHAGDTEGKGDSVEGATPDPIVTTYRWSAGGGTCETCGERVEERWRSGGAFVCVDCKEW